MIDLESMKERERVLINVQCERFFLTVSKPKKATTVFNTLKSSLNLGSGYDKDLWCVITCIGRSLRIGNTGSQFTLDSKHYKTANELQNQNISRRRITKVLQCLHNTGWLVVYKGYYKSENDRMRTCILFTEKLINIFKTDIVKAFSKPFEGDEVVEVRDPKTKEPYMKLTRFKGVANNKQLMLSYNALLREHHITLFSVRCAVGYKQVFTGDLLSAGRIYGFGKFQTMRSEWRKDLKIDGENTTEVDIKGIHPAICRLLQGCDPVTTDFDPYGISGYNLIPRDMFRLLCKYGMMVIINCKTKRGAVKALHNIIKDDINSSIEKQNLTYCHSLLESDLMIIIDHLCDHNNPVEFFGKNANSWQELQRYDSRVCEGVIRRFISRGKPILCWHDSWVCKEGDRQLLIDSIRSAWYEVFSTHNNLFLKVEF